MADATIKYIPFSQQDLITLLHIIELSFEAFHVAGFPPYYTHFLKSLVQLIELGSVAVIHAGTGVNAYRFSSEVDKLWGIISDIKFVLETAERR